MKTLFIVFSLVTCTAQAETLTTSIGDRQVKFDLVQKDKKTYLAVDSNETGKRRLEMNNVNKKFFQETLKDSCYRNLYEAGCHNYSIVIERTEKGQPIKCTFCYNSDIRQAQVARNTLEVLSIAANTAD